MLSRTPARAGVLEEVTASLKNNYPTLDWTKIADYNPERMASHGERRAAEMEESAATLREARPRPADGRVHRQASARDGRDRKARTRTRNVEIGAAQLCSSAINSVSNRSALICYTT